MNKCTYLPRFQQGKQWWNTRVTVTVTDLCFGQFCCWLSHDVLASEDAVIVLWDALYIYCLMSYDFNLGYSQAKCAKFWYCSMTHVSWSRISTLVVLSPKIQNSYVGPRHRYCEIGFRPWSFLAQRCRFLILFHDTGTLYLSDSKSFFQSLLSVSAETSHLLSWHSELQLHH